MQYIYINVFFFTKILLSCIVYVMFFFIKVNVFFLSRRNDSTQYDELILKVMFDKF